ncbi:MAG: RluA family pseudouridine synthase, partial [Oligoflexia bacterium]|nr:RluA family pseudouridine synthase [Oligoflexia bacterium]
MRHRFVAEKADRLDKLIASQTSLSRKRARRLVERGGVHVDGKKARFASHPVSQGAVVEVRAATNRATAPQLPEVYRDGDVVVVDKPSGLPTQAGRQGGQVHVYGILSGTERYVGLHHRLDTPASGLLLLTLRKGCNAAIAQAFREHLVLREYIAVVLGDPGPKGRFETPIDAQPALTLWRRLSSANGMSTLACTLQTGRTHQIRRHAADAGHPIIGDRRHGGAAGRAWPRLALHAWRL